MTVNPSLEYLSRQALADIARGCVDRKSAFRWFTLGTIDNDQCPQLRTVVLRHVDQTCAKITAYTDARSTKVAEIKANPNVTAMFFDPKRMLQIRLSGITTLVSQGDNWRTRWNSLSERAKQDYATRSTPGHTLSGELTYDLALSEENFMLIEISLRSMDWLSLARDGHKRAKVTWDKAGKQESAAWVTP